MSDSNDAAHVSHEGPIKTPTQLVWAVVASFVIPIVIIILLVNFVAIAPKPGAGSDGFGDKAIARRLMPIEQVEIRDVNAPRVLKTGEQVYRVQCAACHDAGVAGAPKIGDNAAWAPRIATGYEALLNASLKGKGAMAPQGGGEHSDYEIGRAVVFMANQSGGDVAEPPAPAEGASAAANGASAPAEGASAPAN